MTISDLNELISIIPQLLDWFLAGFIFVSVYNWIKNIKRDNGIVLLASLFVTYGIRLFCQVIHFFIFPNNQFPSILKTGIYCLLGAILPFILVWLHGTNAFRRILSKYSHKSINDDVLWDVFDYDKPMGLRLFLKDGRSVSGFFRKRDERDIGYIVLIKYRVYKQNGDLAGDYSKKRSVLIVPANEIVRMETVYTEDSKVWERLRLQDKPDTGDKKD